MRCASQAVLSMVVALMAVAGPAAAQVPDTTPVKIRFGYVTGIAFPTFIVAEDRGYFAKEHLTVEKTYLPGSGAVSEALAAGNLDMGNTAPSSSILATVKGGKTIMVSGYEYTFTDKTGKSWEAVYLVVRKGEGIKTLTDLKGKRVAINDIGSYYNYLLREQLLANRIDPEREVTIIPVPFGQMAGALVQKQVDAMIAVTDGYHQAQQRAAVEIIGSHTSLERLDVGLSSAVGVNNEFLRKNPGVVVRFLRAFLQARLWMAEAAAKNEPELVNLIAKSMKYAPERAKAFYETRGGYYGRELESVNLLDIPVRLVNRQFEVLKAAGLLKPDTPADYNAVVDIRLLKQAYETLGLKWDETKHR